MTESPFVPAGKHDAPRHAGARARKPVPALPVTDACETQTDLFRDTGRDGAGRTLAGRIIMDVRAALLSAQWAWAATAHG